MERLTTRNIAGVAVYKNPFECDRCGDTIWWLPDYCNGSPTEELADYEDAEEQGLLLRLKCKVGDTIYHIVGRIILEVENVDLFFLLLSVAEGRFWKTVFLAKEEAETMLKKWKVIKMKIIIDIPNEFTGDYIADKFKDFFSRVVADIDCKGLCGNYEKEIAEMFIKAFEESEDEYGNGGK